MLKIFTQLLALLKKFGITVNPGVVALIMFGIPVLILLGVQLKRYLEKRKAEKQLTSSLPPGLTTEARPSLKPDALVSVWDRFEARLPAEFRRAIFHFQPFVVIGPSLWGKTGLVQAFTDCQRQQNQFLESAVDDPSLQVFLGGSVVVQELSASLLKDASPAARKALLRLWQRTFRSSAAPIVVVPVRLSELSRIPAEVLVETAELIRGKVNLLAMALDRRVEVRIALTHLDEYEGFEEFVAFSRKAKLELSLPVESVDQRYVFEGKLDASFKGFTRYLSLALTKLPSTEYRRILTFLHTAPAQFEPLIRFLDILFATDSVSPVPIASTVCLTSSKREGLGASPFAAGAVLPAKRRHDPLAVHRAAALGLVAVPLAYFAMGHRLEHELWQNALDALANYTPQAMSDSDESETRAQIVRFTERYRGDHPVRYFPSFYAAADVPLRTALADRIRDGRLLPGLEKAGDEDWAHLRTLYFLGVIYAAQGNELATSVLANLSGWAAATGLSEGMLRDYVQSAPTAWNKEIAGDDLPSVITFSSAEQEERWTLLMRSLQEGMARGVYDSLEFQELQKNARRMLSDVRASQALVDRFAEAPRIFAMLMRTAPAARKHRKRYEDFFAEFAPTPQYLARLRRQEAILARVVASALPVPEVAPDSLEKITRKLRMTLEAPADSGEEVLVDVAGESARFEPRAWSEVVRASSIRRHILTFIGQNATNVYGVFFPPEVELDPVLMNPRGGGTLIFRGTAKLDGPYTRRGYEKYVRPALRDFEVIRARLPAVCDPEKRELDTFLRMEVRQYAETYAEQLTRYYKAFDVSADFPEAILVMIRQMLSDRSPFRDFLGVITENSKLPLDGGTYDTAIRDELATFDNWQKIMVTDADAASAELDKYHAILAQLQTALETGTNPRAEEGEAAADAPAEKVEATDLDSALNPVGRVALTLLDRRSQQSFRGLVARWLDDVGLQAFLREPFLAPLREVERVGRREVERAVADAWERRMLVALNGLMRKFPFDPDSAHDATPSELEALLHPVKGLFFENYRQFVAPITRVRGAQLSAISGLDVPRGMYGAINAAKLLSDELWAPTGDPKPYRMRVSPVPFDNSSRDMDSVLTLVYLSSGATSMFNFNQKSYPKTLEIDWTKPSTSQVGVQLTDVSTRRNSYPNPIVAQASYWSFLRLFRGAQVKGNQWTFSFSTSDDGHSNVAARFSLDADPWQRFRLLPVPVAVNSPLADAKVVP